ncbi:MAG: hypothetical protein AB7I59_21355 [Geminicoccaceae bacterium]
MLNTLTRASKIATLSFALGLAAGGAAMAQDAAEQPGCTTVNGVSVGADCEAEGAGSAAGAVENGMPATKHQEELLGTDESASQGQNMEATGAGGAELPATQHQADVMQKPAGGEEQQKAPGQ